MIIQKQISLRSKAKKFSEIIPYFLSNVENPAKGRAEHPNPFAFFVSFPSFLGFRNSFFPYFSKAQILVYQNVAFLSREKMAEFFVRNDQKLGRKEGYNV